MIGSVRPPRRLPQWFRRSLPDESSANRTHEVLEQYRLNTVCESALCPNRSECYAHGTATFMILGNICTRSCGFCAIEAGRPEMVSDNEPERVAEAAASLGLDYVVVTSVARDDLADEGAGHFARTICALRRKVSGVRVEVLTPDFHARRELIETVTNAGPDVYNHNVESVPRLQKKIRPQASFERSLKVLETVKDLCPAVTTKSGLMLGLGETLDEVRQTASMLRSAGCDLLTLGQYLSPGPNHLVVESFIQPEIFLELAEEFKVLGFRDVFAGPYVRSSYHAGETFLRA